MLGEKIRKQPNNPIGLLKRCEMVPVEDMDLGLGCIAQIGNGSWIGEEVVAITPQDEGRDIHLLQQGLPRGIAFDVVPIIEPEIVSSLHHPWPLSGGNHEENGIGSHVGAIIPALGPGNFWAAV